MYIPNKSDVNKIQFSIINKFGIKVWIGFFSFLIICLMCICGFLYSGITEYNALIKNQIKIIEIYDDNNKQMKKHFDKIYDNNNKCLDENNSMAENFLEVSSKNIIVIDKLREHMEGLKND